MGLMKRCRWCHQDKPVDDFPRNRGMADGRLNKCRDCVCAYERRRRATDPRVQAAERKRYADGRKAVSLANYQQRHPEPSKISKRAALIVYRARKRGEIVKPTACEQCGSEGVAIEAAHADYSRPLDVRWLCRRCHRRWDSEQPKTVGLAS